MYEDSVKREPALPETSSGPSTIPEEQRCLYQEVLSQLQQRGIPFAVAGAFALREHTGIYRDTKDLDLFLTAEDAIRATAALHEDGFECEVCDPVWLYKVHRGRFFVDLITGMSNAALVVDPSWIERSKRAVVHGVQTCVLGAEELLASKLFVIRRERFDGGDIAHVIYGTRGQLDWRRVTELAGENWEILFWALVLFHYVYPAQAEYVPQALWQDLMARFQEGILHPDPKARFRGSLVDERIFAIDLKEWGLEDLLEVNRRHRLQEIQKRRTQ